MNMTNRCVMPQIGTNFGFCIAAGTVRVRILMLLNVTHKRHLVAVLHVCINLSS